MDVFETSQPVTALREHGAEIVRQVTRTKRAVTLTLDGTDAVVMQDAEAYQRLLDIAAIADEEEAMRQADDDILHGRTRPAQDVFDELRAKHNIPR